MIDIFKNISKAISTTPETSLHSYIQYARPPPMPLSSTAPKPPPSAHKSHKNHLQVEPNPRRKLQNMHLLHGEFLSERVRQFTDQHVPKDTDSFLEDSDIETGVRLSIPCAPFDIQLQNLGRVVDVESTHKWVKYYPLQTLQRAVHLAFPESADYRFTDFRGPDLDEDIMRWSTWTCHNSPSAYNTPAVVFVQPPWILSLADFESFIRCPSLLNADSFKGTFASDERLWAKIWDVCFQRKSCFFIVTTYWGWVLGAFSKAWSNGFVTRIHDFSESQPTILESLLYWIASAMGIEGSWQVPEVPEPVHHFGLEALGLIPPPPISRLAFVPSESDWSKDTGDARSDTASESTVNADETAVMTDRGEDSTWLVSDASDAPPYKRIPRQMQSHSITRWQADVVSSTVANPARFTRLGSPAPTQCSASTIQDHTELSNQGAWLSGNADERRADYD